MRSGLYIFSLLLVLSCGKDNDNSAPSATTEYFPPIGSPVWETQTPESLGWNIAALTPLYALLETEKTRAFIVLKDGHIVLEKYWGNTIIGGQPFTQNSLWYWASAGKTLTAFTVGLAQRQGFLDISHTSSRYIGVGWTSLPRAKEDLITIRHQLTMSTGLDDVPGSLNDTTAAALRYKADAGARWAYHNAPYTLLESVVKRAVGSSFDAYFETQLRNKIGMDGNWRWDAEGNHVYWSTPRSMARFGLLMLRGARWEGNTILDDDTYVRAMTKSSQGLNLSYGYLWWLNGKGSAMFPQSQVVFPISLAPAAPADMYAAMGKNGQFLNVVPSKGLVVVRMGENAGTGLVPVELQDEIWKKLNAVVR